MTEAQADLNQPPLYLFEANLWPNGGDRQFKHSSPNSDRLARLDHFWSSAWLVFLTARLDKLTIKIDRPQLSLPDTKVKLHERAYTSPIWYTP